MATLKDVTLKIEPTVSFNKMKVTVGFKLKFSKAEARQQIQL